MPTLQLHGCALEPLGDYLKALGIFRLVSEQISPQARCWWKHGIFYLWLPSQAGYSVNGVQQTIPSNEAGIAAWLQTFFFHACTYSPLLAPWQKSTGYSFFLEGKRDRGLQALEVIFDNHKRAYEAIYEALSALGVCFGIAPLEQPPTKQYLKDLAKCVDDSDFIKGFKSNNQGSQKGLKPHTQARLLERVRNGIPDPRTTAWLDVVGQPLTSRSSKHARDIRWNQVLGEGAGEGSGGMMVTVLVALAAVFDGDTLKTAIPKDKADFPNSATAQEWLRASLHGTPAPDLLRSSYALGIFYPPRKGDPNLGQGFEGNRRGAAWDVILLFEGVLLFAGSMARRLNARKAVPAFPFYCGSSLGANSAASSTEIEGSKKSISSGEVWCPVWNQPATLGDLTGLFSDGRIQIEGRDARLATQFIRALGRHGCDRGITAFQRYGLLRRSGSYSSTGQDRTSTLAIPLGLYTASPNSDLTLLDDLIDFEEYVLDASGRRAILDSDSQPRRIIQARRFFEEALFDASRSGLESHRQEATTALSDFRLKLMDVAVAAARLERECGVTDGRIHRKDGTPPPKDEGANVPCAPSLTFDWLRLRHDTPSQPPKRAELPDDGTHEWRLARALGTICPRGKKPEGSKRNEPRAVGPIRENLVRLVRSQGGMVWDWEPESRRAVWLWSGEILGNCAAVLHRRLIDAQAGSGNGLPLFSPYGADAADVLALWHRAVDEERLNELLHGFALIRPCRKGKPDAAQAVISEAGTDDDESQGDDEFTADYYVELRAEETASEFVKERWLERLDLAAQLPRAYALLKLCFLGGRLPSRPDDLRSGKEPYAPGNLNILILLLAGRADEACTAAARRLHYAGYSPLFATSESFSAGFALSHEECRRLAGLLLVPITFASDLARLVIKPSTKDQS